MLFIGCTHCPVNGTAQLLDYKQNRLKEKLFHNYRRKLVFLMLFAFVVALYFSVFFSIAAVMEFCLFRLDNFRRTQRSDYPAICHLIDRIWSISHLTFIFEDDEDHDWEEEVEPTSAYYYPDVRDFFIDASQKNNKAA